jgi:uncharacterized protein YlxP (DUF503 family)
MVAVGLLTLRVHINHAQSLKDKRQVLRALKDRLRRFNVAVSEVDFQETWQRSEVAVVTVSQEESHATAMLARAESEAEKLLGGDLTSSEIVLL